MTLEIWCGGRGIFARGSLKGAREPKVGRQAQRAYLLGHHLLNLGCMWLTVVIYCVGIWG